jgi:hypothetical protein
MIEREAIVKVYNETLGAKGVKGKLVRVSDDGFYEITLEIGGKNYTSLLPISSTVLLAGEPQEELPGIQVER